MRLMDDNQNHPDGTPRYQREVDGSPVVLERDANGAPTKYAYQAYPELRKVTVAYELQTFVHRCDSCSIEETREVHLKLREDRFGEFIEEDLVIQSLPPKWKVVKMEDKESELCPTCQARLSTLLPSLADSV